MLIDSLKSLFTRDLIKLRKEIEQYPSESSIWKIENKIANSGGNLCLHLIGNLNTYIGKGIGGTEYVRDREAEFALKDVPRDILLSKIDETILVVNAALDTLNSDQLDKEYPIVVLERSTSYSYFLLHLAMHLSYHLGQVNYHRRMINM